MDLSACVSLLQSFQSSYRLSYCTCCREDPLLLSACLIFSLHLFLGLLNGRLPLGYELNQYFAVLFSSILMTCPNQRSWALRTKFKMLFIYSSSRMSSFLSLSLLVPSGYTLDDTLDSFLQLEFYSWFWWWVSTSYIHKLVWASLQLSWNMSVFRKGIKKVNVLAIICDTIFYIFLISCCLIKGYPQVFYFC